MRFATFEATVMGELYEMSGALFQQSGWEQQEFSDFTLSLVFPKLRCLHQELSKKLLRICKPTAICVLWLF